MLVRRGDLAGLFTFLLILSSLGRCWAESGGTVNDDLAATVRRFYTPVDAYQEEEFASRVWIEELFQKQQRTGVRRLLSRVEGLDQGILISRSQVEQLRRYLRRTRRFGNVFDRQLTLRFLPDSNYLIRLYNRGDNAMTLRRAATELGGYERLLSLSKTSHGQDVLAEGLRQGRTEAIVLAADELSELTEDEGAMANAEKRRERWLFTVNELIQELDHAAFSVLHASVGEAAKSPQVVSGQ
ncbi:MAG: hypothetical protein AAGA92_05655 [Planctomycetota bacterium]